TIEEDETLEEVVVKMLESRGDKIACAESCTGGLLAGRLINVPGASNVLEESFITYSNEAKKKYLGVKEDTLKAHGAVSEETAREMAEGVLRASGADIGVGITTCRSGRRDRNKETGAGLYRSQQKGKYCCEEV
ncbi:CinA family protein, partial [Anaerostipes caccae]|uniref:CinA family protein n=1 Tax=Anaerostipes caccae TaxID=105841 RepID=UPI002ED2CDAA